MSNIIISCVSGFLLGSATITIIGLGSTTLTVVSALIGNLVIIIVNLTDIGA